jgi:hypothetical protein
MNYPGKNLMGKGPEPDDELPEDPELKNLLAEWKAPEIPGALDRSVLAAYRGQFPTRSRWRWLTGSIHLPAPLAAAAALLLLTTSYLAARKAPSFTLESLPTAPQVKIVEVPTPVARERVVTRVVYRNAGARKATEGPTPVSLPPRDDLADFRPVSAIKIIVSHGGSDAK